MTTKIGIVLITGFLGSGKTTLLRRLLHDRELGSRIAILVNEFGQVGLDEELIRSEHRTKTLHIKQLSSGCICCMVQGNLAEALDELCQWSDRKPEMIFIETSGISNVSELSYAINMLSQDKPYYTDSVITVVDAHHAKRAYAEAESTFLDQLVHADVVLINKADLVPSQAEKDALSSWLSTLAKRATCLWTTRSNVSLSLLSGLQKKAPTNQETQKPKQERGHDFTQVTLFIPDPIAYADLEDWLFLCADKVFRIKGIVDVWDEESMVYPLIVQAVGDRVDTEPLTVSSPEWENPRYLVLIGSNLSKQDLQSSLEKQRTISFPSKRRAKEGAND